MSYSIHRLGFIAIVSIWNISLVLGAPLASKSQKLAQENFDKKSYQKVVEILEPQVEVLSIEELLLLGKSYSFLKNNFLAAKYYQSALALDPKNPEAMALLGGAWILINKEKDGISQLKESLNLSPQNQIAYSTLAKYYESKNNKYELRLLYEDQIKYAGESEDAVTKLCDLYTLGGLYDLSKKSCLRGIEMNPKIPENYLNLAVTLKSTGDSESAEEQYKKAVLLFPKSLPTLLGYARNLEEQKKFSTAYTYYKQANQLFPDSVDAALGTGIMGVELQKFKESLPIFEKVCSKSKPAIIGFRKALTMMRSQKGNPSTREWLVKYENALGRCDKF